MTSTPVTLGLDLGTSGLKAVAVQADGTQVAEANRSYPLLTPRPGWTEQRPEDWIAAVDSALTELAGTLATLGAVPVALGLSGQMHGLVPLGAHGDVLRPALLWNDQRTGAQVRDIEQRVPRRDLVARTGNRAVTGFQLPKVLWMQDEEPALYARLRHALLPKDYLGYVLTGRLATEPSDASGVGALHLERREEARLLNEARQQLERVGLGDCLYEPAGSLALGQQRILEIARALCADPCLLLLDEPAAGLRLKEKEALGLLLSRLRSEGMAILLVEHDMDFVMGLVDRVVVMEFGQRIAQGLPEEMQSNPAVLEAYLGGVE